MSASMCKAVGRLRGWGSILVVAGGLAGLPMEAATISKEANRGTITVEAESLGAFSFLSSPSGATLSFRGAIWTGVLPVVSAWPDEALPGRFTGSVIVTNGQPPGGDTPVWNLPVEMAMILPSTPWVYRPLALSNTQSLRMNEPPDVLRFGADAAYSYTLTASQDGLSVRFNGTAQMSLAGGGMASLTVSGSLSRAGVADSEGIVNFSAVLRLTDADGGRYLGSNVLLTVRESGTWQAANAPAPSP